MPETIFQYNLRFSPRARNVRLRVSVDRGFEVVVPTGYDTARVPRLLEQKREWIRVALNRAETHRKFFEPKPAWRMPARIQLPAIGKSWDVMTRSKKSSFVTIREVAPNRLVASGPIRNESASRAALSRWLRRQTRAHLLSRVEQLSQRSGLRYRRGMVRHQKKRWASCSRRRNIALNLRLLFLPREVVDYVIIHELCHTAELNHSKKFWALVSHNCPNYRYHDAQLRSMWKHIPHWA
jgi:predicted metal-dependent hydrolase